MGGMSYLPWKFDHGITCVGGLLCIVGRAGAGGGGPPETSAVPYLGGTRIDVGLLGEVFTNWVTCMGPERLAFRFLQTLQHCNMSCAQQPSGSKRESNARPDAWLLMTCNEGL